MSYMLIVTCACMRHASEHKKIISAMPSAAQLICELVNHIHYTWFLSTDVNTVFTMKEKVDLEYLKRKPLNMLC